VVRQSADPFGSRHAERGPGWLRIVVGLAVVAAGVAATVVGISGAVAAAGDVEDDAVGRAGLRDTVTFTVPDGRRRAYSVWLLFGGVERNSVVRELMVRDTGCTATLPDGARTVFRGARQGTAATLGDASSVGHFSSQTGTVTVRCEYVSGTRRSERVRADDVPFVVSPGTPGEASADVVWIVGGVFGALGGAYLAWSGWRRRRVFSRSAA
jgi:hypothetical protein